MANLHILLNTNKDGHRDRINSLKRVLHSNFKPRSNKDGTKALLHLKEGDLSKLATLAPHIFDHILGMGDSDWARQVIWKDWNPRTGNDWEKEEETA